MTPLIRPPKPDRSRIDLSDPEIANQWVKKLKKSKEEIAAAISKVGDNAKTVVKELRTNPLSKPAPTAVTKKALELRPHPSVLLTPAAR